MTVAVCTLGCTRKKSDIYSWSRLAELEGDYRLYINWEQQELDVVADICVLEDAREKLVQLHDVDIDIWSWREYSSAKSWRSRPQFDQDQARLASIVTARNMCIEYAMQTECSYLLFVDSDIVPPVDIIPKLLEVFADTNYLAVGGLVYGRGIHASCPYLFGEKRRWSPTGKYELTEVEHANVGYMMIARRAFEQVRFRYGVSEYPDGRKHMISDDPAFHLDCFVKFHEWTAVRMDVVGTHIGNLDAKGVSQY